MSDENGLVYMRARYYSPTLKRFINADVVAGSITNAITLNRYAYANGNPVSNVDPFGLSADNRGTQGDYITIQEPMEGKTEGAVDVTVAESAWAHNKWGGLTWYSSADEAAYHFGMKYRDERLEWAGTIYSIVVYEYHGAWYTLGQIQHLHNTGEIPSMQNFFQEHFKNPSIYCCFSI